MENEDTEKRKQAKKAWREVKRVANDRTKWKNFTSALCSERSNRW
jgi:hypothetical protein